MLGWLDSGAACRLFGHHLGRNFLRTAITRMLIRWEVNERGGDYSLLVPSVYKCCESTDFSRAFLLEKKTN